ncbi:hypothetical protein NQ315_014018 [Exocentrus adspersus]|uniref:YqaJ viral recombinase domain-containing protein n=1 Tax=Exocentrus adspersus TaxID=1586481 RepID=A0AAV8V6I2_9CUCU|nr:hypothetical protein NQ315_014018 [Exocentrus adspersus]
MIEICTSSYNEDVLTVSSSPTCDKIEDILMRNPSWCHKVYKGPGPSEPIITRSVEYGVIPSDECDSIDNYVLECEKELPNSHKVIEGNRVVELNYVIQETLRLQKKHYQLCTLGDLVVTEEIRKGSGLVSTIVLWCQWCHIYRGSKEKCIGFGKHLCGKVWKMLERGERNYALEKSNVCQDGTPWITVYVDGSWSKRSYGTNYNALSGMVGIIGRYTGELLFIAVRNKFCCVCARAVNKDIEPTPHTCYKNWDGSTTSMEADMAVQGFNMSEEMHGIRYCKFVADGDSSVFAKIKTNVSYGNIVKKVECTNHAIKNYGKHLRQIKKDTSINVEERKLLTINHIEKLTRRAKCSIYEHSQTEENNVQLLKEDLQNGINHVFGDHSKCREGICNIVGDQSNNKVPQLKSSSIYNHLKGALDLLARKAHLLIENENNNRAERLMNIVARFNMGKRLNLIQRGSYERRVDEYRRDEIAKSTVGQFGNDLYECERERRLTVSLFGSVISRKEYTPCHNLVKSCLQPTSFYSKATSFGIAKESVAIALFEKKTGLAVEKSGLWIDLSYGFLGASPDGLIGSNALIEVKCLYSCSDLQVRTIEEVQGQLNICQREKCYFVVYINDEIEVYIEEIKRDEYFWRDKMLPKLIKFYTECIAPEIIRGNFKK